MSGRFAIGAILALACGVTPVNCGGGGGSRSAPPTAPSPPPQGPAAATIRITPAGVEPREVAIAVGQHVMFVNESSVRRDVSSNPHPLHTDCPAINQVGVLTPGQSRATGAFTQARRCGFHDHDDPDNAAVQGAIVVQ